MTDQSIQVQPAAQTFLLGQGTAGVLIIHGLGGTIADFRQFAEGLARNKFLVLGLCLAGHGVDVESLARSHLSDWQASIDAALNELTRQVGWIGCVGASFGGVLAVDAAARNNAVRAAVTVNPAWSFQPNDTLFRIGLRTIQPFVRSIPKPGLTSVQRTEYSKIGSLPAWPVSTLLEAQTVAKQTYASQLPKLKIPVLELAARNDSYVKKMRNSANFIRPATYFSEIIPFDGHRPFRQPATTAWLSQRISQFFKQYCP